MDPAFIKNTHEETPYLTIGKVAAITGATPKAIRHYEALGLLPAPQRRGRYRLYSERDIFLVHVLKHTQSVGFKLSELRELLAEKISSKRFPLTLANTLFDRKRIELEEQIAALQQTRQRLDDLQRDMNQRLNTLLKI